MTHYSIQSHGRSPGRQLKNWVIEGSNDGIKWYNLDTRENVETLNELYDFFIN